MFHYSSYLAEINPYSLFVIHALIQSFSIIDLTEVEETAEVDSHESPGTSQEKRATCPVCQQLFSKEYIAIHAADCELHVDSESDDGGGRILLRASLSSSSKLRQTTLTHKLSSSNTLLKNIIESESDDVEVSVHKSIQQYCYITLTQVTPPPKKRKTRKLLTDKSRKYAKCLYVCFVHVSPIRCVFKGLYRCILKRVTQRTIMFNYRRTI